MARRNTKPVVCLTIGALLLLLLAGCSGEQGVVTPVGATISDGAPTSQQLLVLQGEREMLTEKLLRCRREIDMVGREYGTRDLELMRQIHHKRVADLQAGIERQREQVVQIQAYIGTLEQEQPRTEKNEQILQKVKQDLNTAKIYENHMHMLLQKAEHDAAKLDRVQQSLDELARQLALDKQMQDHLSQRFDREKVSSLLPGK